VLSLLSSDSPDFSALGWSDAFAALNAHLQRDYAFSEWKAVDWRALQARLAPRIAAAEVARDERAFYLALREYAFSFPDGHLDLSGDDRGTRAAALDGGFGLALARLDDGSTRVHVLLPEGPAARAGIEWGARIGEWNGKPPEAAAGEVATLWAESPPATADGLRRAQYLLLSRAPVGTQIDLVFQNPGKEALQRATIRAEDDEMKALELADPRPRLDLRTPVVSWRQLPEGIGYVRVLAEVPTLGGLYPDRAMRRSIAALCRAGVPGIVLDVRGNQGGFDKLVPAMMAFFFAERRLYEQVAYARDGFKPKVDKTLFVEPTDPFYPGPVAVLIDHHTVSSGEGFPLLARALPRGHVVGWSGTHGSFGMAGASVRLPAGLELNYPNGRSLDASGRIQVDSNDRLEGGVLPDVRVPVTEATLYAQFVEGRDVALELAIQTLKR